MTVSEINILVGLQWGSEDKEELTEFLAATSDVTVRFQGCAGAAEAAQPGQAGTRYLPSGISIPGTKSLICAEAFVDLEKIAKEISAAKDLGLLKSQLIISKACHIVFDFHKKLEAMNRIAAGKDKDGEAAWNGVAAAVCDKHTRLGIRAGDLLSHDVLRKKIEQTLEAKNIQFSRVFGAAEFDIERGHQEYLELAEIIAPYIGDAEGALAAAVKSNLRIFFEGTGGAMQDIDRGVYGGSAPCRTLSAPAFQATGGKPLPAARVIGAAKAYVTRTDGGGLISCEKGGIATFIRNRGGESPRTSIGWLDLPMLRYALRENGADVLAITKLNALTGIDTLKICVGHRLDSAEKGSLDLVAGEMERAEPVYKTFPGWREDLSLCANIYDLPAETRALMRYIEEAVKVPVIWIGVGSTRLSELNSFQ